MLEKHILRQPELIVFAKQPLAGQVKSRLQPEYTPQEAAEIAALLIRATVELAVASWPGEIYLYGAPDARHPLFEELAREFDLQLASQGAGDLGARMQAALREGLARRRAAAILGCDVPHCSWDILDQANHWLAQGRNVLGPTEDGGYYFIGLGAPHVALFEGIDWGTDQVLAQTLARAEQLGIEFEWLPRLRDIDTVDDLWLVSQKYAPLRQFLRST
ncbi:MAG: TIGR04282 family arsenosugar biosynthesis glycosyltransferase [Gammaproteobacteria bacterium]|nr:TIGR04282 family arsenosugar biosynthesis glycosyltransferase [Gammaproteobacteria bacterium]